jgi:quinoprotein relay system zinc metallohydrolase 1
MKHALLASLALGSALGMSVLWPAAAVAQAAPKVDVDRLDYGLKARALAPGVWVVEGANADFTVANGCNIINTGFIATGNGVLVINTGVSKLQGEQLRALIARTTAEPVIKVLQLNLHPDYFLGHQGFADVPRLATPATRAGVAREASAYEDNLYRLCGDWMKDTKALPPTVDLEVPSGGQARTWKVGQREFELREWTGHTDSDVVLIDKQSGVAFVGGLVFSKRIPTTPHAKVSAWLESLKALEALGLRTVVPSHGPVHQGSEGIAQTRRYLQWLDVHFKKAAEQGLEMNELLRSPVPEEFKGWAAFSTEYTRNVAHLYPVYEREVLKRGR